MIVPFQMKAAKVETNRAFRNVCSSWASEHSRGALHDILVYLCGTLALLLGIGPRMRGISQIMGDIDQIRFVIGQIMCDIGQIMPDICLFMCEL